MFAKKKFQHYLYGRRFTVQTDHHSLQWLMNATSPVRLVRWVLRLAEYDFEIKYRKADENANANELSRLPLPEISLNSV